MRPGSRLEPSYTDPIYTVLYSLPIRWKYRKKLIHAYQSNFPTQYVYSSVGYYERYDQRIILILRLLAAFSPILLIEEGYSVGITISYVIVLIFITETLDQKRRELERKKTKEETKSEYFEEHIKWQNRRF